MRNDNLRKLKSKLKAISALSGVYLALNQESDAQIVYHDIDPDVILAFSGEQYDLDLDGDGLTNFHFNKWSYYESSSWWAGEVSWAKRVGIFGEEYHNFLAGTRTATGFCSSCYSIFLSPYALDEGDEINFSFDFYVGTAMASLFQNYFKAGGAGNWFPDTEDKYLGIYFEDAAAVGHFGWIRCSVMDEYVLTIKDFAYNLVPDEPVIAGELTPPITLPQWIEVTDEGDDISGSDLSFSFYPVTHENYFDEYRVIAVKDIAAASFSIDDAMAITPSSYLSMTADSSISYFGTLAGLNDSDGEPITNHVGYRLFILTIADPLSAADNLLSVPSSAVILQTPTMAATDVVISDNGELGESPDIKIQFTNAENENVIDHYRIFFLNVSILFDGFLVEDAQSVLPENYTIVEKTGLPFEFQIPIGVNDISGTPITWGVPYYAFVMSVDNGLGTGDILSEVSNELILNFPDDIQQIQDETIQLYIENNILVIESYESTGNNFELQIANSQGQIVMHQYDLTGNSRVPMNFLTGMYIVTLSNGNHLITKQVTVIR